ncbi:MAG: preprotein translocase subunit SecE [Alphaproteobacteria bacterium]|jgi:preprotein translocase subunit SecE
MAKTSPLMFIKQVQMEIRKVSWPTKKETIVTSVMISILAVVAAMFFLAADSMVALALRYILQ